MGILLLGFVAVAFPPKIVITFDRDYLPQDAEPILLTHAERREIEQLLKRHYRPMVTLGVKYSISFSHAFYPKKSSHTICHYHSRLYRNFISLVVSLFE
jgi:hypothetical protein